MSVSQKQQQTAVWGLRRYRSGVCGRDCLRGPFFEAEANRPAISVWTFAAKITSENSSPGRSPPLSGKGRESSRLHGGRGQNNTVLLKLLDRRRITGLMNNGRKWTDQWRLPKQSCQTEQKLFCQSLYGLLSGFGGRTYHLTLIT